VPNVERRRSPRIAVRNHPDLPAGIVDISLGGFSVALRYVLPKESVHDVGLSLSNGAEVVLRVRVAHRRRVVRPGELDVFLTGFEFLADVSDMSTNALRIAS
jgi:PilZ domain